MYVRRGVLPVQAVAPIYTFGAPAVFCEASACSCACSLPQPPDTLASQSASSAGELQAIDHPHCHAHPPPPPSSHINHRRDALESCDDMVLELAQSAGAAWSQAQPHSTGLLSMLSCCQRQSPRGNGRLVFLDLLHISIMSSCCRCCTGDHLLTNCMFRGRILAFTLLASSLRLWAQEWASLSIKVL